MNRRKIIRRKCLVVILQMFRRHERRAEENVLRHQRMCMIRTKKLWYSEMVLWVIVVPHCSSLCPSKSYSVLFQILVNSVTQPALLYENVVVSDGDPIHRDLLFSPDHQHLYALTDNQVRKTWTKKQNMNDTGLTSWMTFLNLIFSVNLLTYANSGNIIIKKKQQKWKKEDVEQSSVWSTKGKSSLNRWVGLHVPYEHLLIGPYFECNCEKMQTWIFAINVSSSSMIQFVQLEIEE